MRIFQKLGVLVAVFALCAIGAANASAANFTASATGSLDGKALANQVFKIHGGADELTCEEIDVTGTITQTISNEQHVTVDYTKCHNEDGVTVDVSPATYLFTANGEVHIKSPITLKVTVPFFPCHITVGEQTVKSVDYANSGSNLIVTPTVTGISYTTTGGFCGSGGSDGTYSGAVEVTRSGGGSLSWDA